MTTHLYTLDGKTPVPCNDIETWGRWFANVDTDKARVVDRTTIDGITVSTVFLGVDHSYDKGTPILFETMVFGGEYDQRMERYHTWEEAEAGHKEMAAEVFK